MAAGLLVIAICDVASAMTSTYVVFLGVRGPTGVGWAMFGTVATTTMVNQPASQRRGRAVSLLLMSETFGLWLGSAAGGWGYQGVGGRGPFVCSFGELRITNRVALLNARVRQAVEQKIHLGDALGAQAPFLTIEGEVAAFSHADQAPAGPSPWPRR
jgi:predicted MFS family arabinose efflux permease